MGSLMGRMDSGGRPMLMVIRFLLRVSMRLLVLELCILLRAICSGSWKKIYIRKPMAARFPRLWWNRTGFTRIWLTMPLTQKSFLREHALL